MEEKKNVLKIWHNFTPNYLTKPNSLMTRIAIATENKLKNTITVDSRSNIFQGI